jgi:hypothetical protein
MCGAFTTTGAGRFIHQGPARAIPVAGRDPQDAGCSAAPGRPRVALLVLRIGQLIAGVRVDEQRHDHRVRHRASRRRQERCWLGRHRRALAQELEQEMMQLPDPATGVPHAPEPAWDPCR